MITHPAYPVDPWSLRETALDLDVLAQSESLFALSNGHIGWRGTLDEGEPSGLPGAYLNGVYESRPLPYAEAGFGYPEAGETIVNVPDGTVIRLLVDDEPLDVRYGQLSAHQRTLDFRSGLLHRTAEWISPDGHGVRISSTRLVSLTQRAVAAVRYEVEPLDTTVDVVVQSELVAAPRAPGDGTDPRAAAALTAPLLPQGHGDTGTGAFLLHSTAVSGLRLGVAMDHQLDGPPSLTTAAVSHPELARLTATATLRPGQRLRLDKIVAYGWSAVRSQTAIGDQVDAALTAGMATGWDELAAAQRGYLDDFWARADVEVDGDPQIQQAVRFALFHLLQASARAEGRAIAAKGLTGPGYDGHAFWDTETFVLPVLTYTLPQAAADALRWRRTTLPLALERAGQLGLDGAVFPWRTIAGSECSGYWPAGTAAFHLGADIADAAVRYVTVTGDTDFETDTGIELLVATARMWRALGYHDAAGRFRIDGVTGPDEYSALADNNVYTNLMAAHNLRSAADVTDRHPARADELGARPEEVQAWRTAAEAMVIPYDEELGVHCQDEAFTRHERWDFATTTPEMYPLLLHIPYFDLYRKQVCKQADLVLAMHLRGEAFTAAEKARDFGYYEPLTVRDSSLSACTQAVLAAETGHLDLAYDYLTETALTDLDDLQHNTRDGLHLASLAGTWIALVAGLAGLRDQGGRFAFAPRLPAGITRLAVSLGVRGRRLRVEITPQVTSYRLLTGDSLEIWHDSQPVSVRSEKTSRRPTTQLPAMATPAQPPGRRPIRHRTSAPAPSGAAS